jgi:hypothetical protein
VAFPKQSTRATVTSTAGAWKKVVNTPLADRLGVRLFVPRNAALDLLVRLLPVGTTAPSTFTDADGSFLLYKGDTWLATQDARDNVDIWFCGADGLGGSTSVGVEELI